MNGSHLYCNSSKLMIDIFIQFCLFCIQVRSAHLNDLENVIPFVLLSLLYIGTNPDPVTALWHFRVSLAANSNIRCCKCNYLILTVLHPRLYTPYILHANCYFTGALNLSVRLHSIPSFEWDRKTKSCSHSFSAWRSALRG